MRFIGKTIQDLRRQLHMTGEELGQRAHLSQSKISKIETGFYGRLKYDEVQKILNILGASKTIQQQILRAVDETAHVTQKHHALQGVTFNSDAGERERGARTIKVYVANGIPALFQTVTYRKASLEYKGFNDAEVQLGIQHTLARQDLIWEGGRTYHIIIPQAALYTLVTSRRQHLVQLDRLERYMGLSNLKLGIISVTAGQVLAEHGSFALYDDQTLVQALPRGETSTQDALDIELCREIFVALDRLAGYGEDAVQLVRKAMEYFA